MEKNSTIAALILLGALTPSVAPAHAQTSAPPGYVWQNGKLVPRCPPGSVCPNQPDASKQLVPQGPVGVRLPPPLPHPSAQIMIRTGKMINWARAQLGHCVADEKGTIRPGTCGPDDPGVNEPGECTHLVESALVLNGFKPSTNYVWGARAIQITSAIANRPAVAREYIRPGDVLQFWDFKLVGPNGSNGGGPGTHHTAMVETVPLDGAPMKVIEQHAPHRTVTEGYYDLSWTIASGHIDVYRPIPIE